MTPIARDRRKISFADAGAEALRCDSLGCLFRNAGQRVALIWNERAFSEECGREGVLIATVPIPRPCRTHLSVGRFDLWREGAHAVWLTPGRVRVETVRAAQGQRLWTQWRK